MTILMEGSSQYIAISYMCAHDYGDDDYGDKLLLRMYILLVDDKDETCDEIFKGDEQGQEQPLDDDKLTVFEESLRWPATNSCSVQCSGL